MVGVVYSHCNRVIELSKQFEANLYTSHSRLGDRAGILPLPDLPAGHYNFVSHNAI